MLNDEFAISESLGQPTDRLILLTPSPSERRDERNPVQEREAMNVNTIDTRMNGEQIHSRSPSARPLRFAALTCGSADEHVRATRPA